jgi:hypothetical protein
VLLRRERFKGFFQPTAKATTKANRAWTGKSEGRENHGAGSVQVASRIRYNYSYPPQEPGHREVTQGAVDLLAHAFPGGHWRSTYGSRTPSRIRRRNLCSDHRAQRGPTEIGAPETEKPAFFSRARLIPFYALARRSVGAIRVGRESVDPSARSRRGGSTQLTILPLRCMGFASEFRERPTRSAYSSIGSGRPTK